MKETNPTEETARDEAPSMMMTEVSIHPGREEEANMLTRTGIGMMTGATVQSTMTNGQEQDHAAVQIMRMTEDMEINVEDGRAEARADMRMRTRISEAAAKAVPGNTAEEPAEQASMMKEVMALTEEEMMTTCTPVETSAAMKMMIVADTASNAGAITRTGAIAATRVTWDQVTIATGIRDSKEVSMMMSICQAHSGTVQDSAIAEMKDAEMNLTAGTAVGINELIS
jgi:hypothetical protein